MATITAQTTFEITDVEYFVETVDLIILPENAGINAWRELHYPGNVLPPLIYDQNPDRWENFDSIPLTNKITAKTDQTIGGNESVRWPGYLGDRQVKEIWKGDDKKASTTAYFFRRLWDYFNNPPASGYIQWYPKDRTETGYLIEIEDLTVNGSEVNLDYLAIRAGYLIGDLTLSFRIIGEA